jgi:hypothetical protein
MNWHYGNPIKDGEYICCIRGYATPMAYCWVNGQWGVYNSNYAEFDPIDNNMIVCYIGLDEISMPEGW